MAPSRIAVVGAAAAVALLFSSCGQASDDETGSGLQPPQPVRVAGAPGAASAEAQLGSDAGMSTMPAFMEFTYEVGPDLPALPTDATGYRYPPDAEVDAARVAELAAALGVGGEPIPGGGAEVDGLAWRVGPDDGSAPQLTVGADAQSSVNYSQAWSTATSTRCAVAEGSPGGVSPDAEVVSPPTTACEEPEPPANVPSADEAEVLAGGVLEAISLDPATFEFETYADEWAASVTAWSRLDGVRSPITWSFGFGGNGDLQWMNGTLAIPVATGPYPLIGLDEAVERLEEQSAWVGFGGPSMDLAIASDSASAGASEPPTALPDPTVPAPSEGETAPPDTSTSPATIPLDSPPVDTVPVDTVPVDTVPVEMAPEVALLVDVRADLWWAWDDDGSVWLLPAYTFTDTEGRAFTVPAVTDEFLIIPEPTLVEPKPLEPAPGEPPVDPNSGEVPEPDLGYLVGLSVADAEQAVGGSFTVRVVVEDGVALAVTEDFSTSRVNVEVADGVVVAVVSIG